MNNHDDRFDAALRAHHAAALSALSPRAQAQLAQRRNAVLRDETATRRTHGFRYAAAVFAGVCALAIGMQFQSTPTPAESAAPPRIATIPAPASNGANTGATLLDEDPEFYAWLASSDAKLVAME